MVGMNAQIKALIHTAYQYQLKKNDKNLAQLQRQLQILAVVSDLSVFEPTCMETLEFYVCLEQLLTELEPKCILIWKVINLLFHMCRSSNIRVALRDEIQILPPLTKVILNSKMSKDKTMKILGLIHDISSGIKVTRHENWIMKVIPYIVSSMVENPDDDETTETLLSILGNLCRGNPTCINVLQSFTERKVLLKTLSEKKNSTCKFQLLVAELMVNLEADFSKLEENQVTHLLDLLFAVAIDGVSKNDEVLIELSKNIFDEFCSSPKIQNSLLRYDKFSNQCQALLEFVTGSLPDNVAGHLFLLLSLIIQVESADVNSCINAVFTSTLPFVRKNGCGSNALALLHSVLQYCDDNTINERVEAVLDTIKESLLEQDGGLVTADSLDWMNRCIGLLTALCRRDPFYCAKVAKAADATGFMQFLRGASHAANTSPQFYAQESIHAAWTLNNKSNSVNLMNSVMDHGDRRAPSGNIPSRENCSKIVVKILYLLKLLSPYKQEFMEEYSQVFNSIQTMRHVVQCMRSSDAALVMLSMNILTEGTVPNDSIVELVKAQVELNVGLPAGIPVEAVTAPRPAQFTAACEENVDSLLKQLNFAADKSDMRDLPLTDVIELYEYKLAGLAHNETYLYDALAAADTQKRRVQQTLLQSRAENTRLRNLLQIWEKRLQESHRDRDQCEEKVTLIKDSAKQLRESLLKEKTKVERDLSCSQKELSVVRANHQRKEEELRKMTKQAEAIENEKRSLHVFIQEQEKKTAKLQERIGKFEDDQKKKHKDYEELEKENAKLEKNINHMKKENNELELVVRSHEQAIVEKDNQLDELTKTNSALKRIQDMIHNISSAKAKK